jgi:hypothetical protein
MGRNSDVIGLMEKVTGQACVVDHDFLELLLFSGNVETLKSLTADRSDLWVNDDLAVEATCSLRSSALAWLFLDESDFV